MSEIIGWVCALLIVTVVCGSITYSCVSNNQRYYDASTECMRGGGSVIPQGLASFICVQSGVQGTVKP